MTRVEQGRSQGWYEQLPLEQAQLVNTLFPFKRPPLEVARNCFLVADPQLQLSGGYHDTSSNILLFPRPDRKLLIPAEAFGKHHPEFDLHVIVSHTLPITHRENGRRWAVWCSRIPYTKSQYPIPLGFTPVRAEGEVAKAENIIQIYKSMLGGDTSPALQENLKKLMNQIIQGFWFRYYTDQLPKMISDSKSEAEKIIAELFSGLDRKIDRAIKYWGKLTPDDQKLLANAFRIVVKTKFSPPFAYFGAGIDEIRKNELTEDRKLAIARDPLEIVARTQGVSTDEVEAVYISDGAKSPDIYPIVLQRLRALGFEEKVRPFLELNDISKYPTCDAPYARFNLGLLAQYLLEGKLIPLVPSEWQASNVLKQE